MNAPAPIVQQDEQEVKLKAVEDMKFHPISEQIVELIMDRAQNTDPNFFRVLVAFYWSMVASNMRATILPPDNKPVPVNMYAVGLMPSGAGKGIAMKTMEEEVIDQFQNNFEHAVMPLAAKHHLAQVANVRAAQNGTDPDDELEILDGEYKSAGDFVFSFDEATEPALKQVRHKLLLAQAGALSLIVDEVGSNLTSIMEVLPAYLELYDVGRIKQKLTKNTNDNRRLKDIVGRTPTNMNLFGTPAALLNGSKIEDEFTLLLETGYARRCFFGYTKRHLRPANRTVDAMYEALTDTQTQQFIEQLSDHLGDLADISQLGRTIAINEPEYRLLLEYRLRCENYADRLPDHEEIRRAEISHRYFKVLKLAGAYAFIEGCSEIKEEHLYYAMKLAEESGKAFYQIMTRDPVHVKLANYIADVRRPVTQADLVADLPFYKGHAGAKAEMLQLAIAYGYRNNIIIKKAFEDGVEFISGETLKRTDLEDMHFSYSTDWTEGYGVEPAPVPFDELHKLVQAKDIHWCSHAFKEGHRSEDNAIPGFNMLVLDVDSGISLSTARELLADYKALFYTTKRHQWFDPATGKQYDDRFRIILPMNYTLELDAKEHREFWENVYAWLPFEVDHASSQRSRKWMSCDANEAGEPSQYFYQDGQILDILPFIPKTSKNEEFKQRNLDQRGMDNLERWFVNNTGDGNRNKMLHKFAMLLVDAGFDFNGIRQRVNELNDKLPDKLDEAEILGTVMVTVGKALAAK